MRLGGGNANAAAGPAGVHAGDHRRRIAAQAARHVHAVDVARLRQVIGRERSPTSIAAL